MNNERKSELKIDCPEKANPDRFVRAAELVYWNYERFCCLALDAHYLYRQIKMAVVQPEPPESVIFARMFKPKRLPKTHRITGWWGSTDYLENQDARVMALCLAAAACADFE